MQLVALSSSAATGLARPTQHRAVVQNAFAPATAPAWRWCARLQRAVTAAAGGADPPAPSPAVEGDSSEGLLPEEDAQIPGGWMDAMSSNTPLGKAVKGACEELDTLGSLEKQTLEEAEGLLKQLGFQGSLFTAPPQQEQDAEEQQEGQAGAAAGDDGA